ncbi:MAG: hypothetical protein M3R04_04325 [bacterium]|nr:hypothetical protein [bacterium]
MFGHAATALLVVFALVLPAAAQAPPPAGGADVSPVAEGEDTYSVGTYIPPAAPLPEPVDLELIDVPNDGGNQLAALWTWPGEVAENISVAIEVRGTTELLEKYQLTEAQRNTLSRAREQLAADLAPLLPERDRLADEKAAADAEKTLLETALPEERDPGAIKAAWIEFWRVSQELQTVQDKVARARDRFLSRAGKIAEKARQHDWLEAAIASGEYLPTNGSGSAAALPHKGDFPDVYGMDAEGADKLYLLAGSILVRNPAPLEQAHDEYDEAPPGELSIPLEQRRYVARLAVTDGIEVRYHGEGPVEPSTTLFKTTLTNSFFLALTFALIILGAVVYARRNPDKLFIRRIAGLEAVDEAIGRATEMGKPVLYLPGMTDLTDLATLASINILGRVARKVAEYDSDLLVPTRDPVVMTVAQEVVRAGYMDMGRPDAFKESNIFFVTQDQFSYTATTCGIMLREKPAANFFMGYYYAEALLLAETGQSTGAIQIAGTDSQNQLPFFITTCDYTLIGEELYAASAYLSREPLLLGSLKGLDLAKAVIILAIIAQTVLFLFGPDVDFIKNIFVPL